MFYFMMKKIISVILPVALWGIVSLVYAYRRPIQMSGFPVDPYFLALFAFPAALVLLRKVSFADMGFKIGKPLTGLFLVFLLPGVLFLRFYFTGRVLHLAAGIFLIMLGSALEEFFFRGYLQGQFKKFLGTTAGSFLLVNILFALIHLIKGYSLPALVTIGVVGLYFSFARDESGGSSVYYSMIAHALYNVVIVAAS